MIVRNAFVTLCHVHYAFVTLCHIHSPLLAWCYATTLYATPPARAGRNREAQSAQPEFRWGQQAFFARSSILGQQLNKLQGLPHRPSVRFSAPTRLQL